MSLFNGLITLTCAMAKRGLLDQGDIAALHSAMMKPLDLEEHAEHEGVAQYRATIDDLISTISIETR
jgi:hypothetical protein